MNRSLPRSQSLATMIRLGLTLTFLISTWGVMPVPVSYAAVTIVVNETADELNGDGDCSLREAISAANTNTTVDGCLHDGSAGLDTITLPAGTYTLDIGTTHEDANADGDLDILAAGGDLTINGAGAGTTIIDGNATERIFAICPGGACGITVTFDGVTIQNGVDTGEGGGIHNQGSTMNLASCILDNNNTSAFGGGGIRNDSGTVNITDSTLSNNSSANDGGGIYNTDGTLNISNSTLINNSSLWGGGGIESWSGVITITNSLLDNNDATEPDWGLGGGIFADGSLTIINSTLRNSDAAGGGGGIYNMGTLNVTNSVLDNNTASGSASPLGGGGINNDGGNATLTHVTIANNTADAAMGGNLFNDATGTLNVTSSIVADHGGGNNCVGTITNGGNNLEGESTASYTCGFGAGNQTTNAGLNALADNGGPIPTIGLQSTSPAVNGTGGTCAGIGNVDQRYFARSDGSCDIGAFEYFDRAISGYVWYDLDGDGQQDATEHGYDGATVTLDSGPTNATTANGGYYHFTSLSQATHTVTFSNLPGGYTFTTQDVGGDDTIDSDANTSTGQTGSYDLSAAAPPSIIIANVDAGLVQASSPSLSIVKTVDNNAPLPGQLITYTLVISNSGGSSATNALISDTLPGELTYAGPLTLDPPGSTLPDPSGANLASGLTITNGETITLTFPVTVNAGLSLGTIITNTAWVTSTEVSTPQQGQVTLTISAPDLSIAKFVDPEPVVAGEPLTYTIVISNVGTASAADAILSDTLPAGLYFDAIDQTDSTAADFAAGTHDNTRWVDPRPTIYGDEHLEIEDTSLTTGTYRSRIIDAMNVVTWTRIAWQPLRPYWKPLPDGGQAESAYDFGNADMGGSRVLLHMDGLPGNVVTDTSGLDNHGTCVACPAAGVDGRFNGALAFDGALSQTVVITDAYDPARYALELWVYVPSGSITDTALIVRADTPTDTIATYSHLLGVSNGYAIHTLYDGAYKTITATAPLTEDMWHHVVGTAQSGGDMDLYVDGVRQAQLGGLGSVWAGGDWYRLGTSYGPTGTHYFTGLLDEVAVYSRTLSSGEILDHYLRGALRLSFSVRSCASPNCSDGTFTGPYSEQSNAGLGLPSVLLSGVHFKHYVQYSATLATDAPAYSPLLASVSFEPAHEAISTTQGSCIVSGASAFTCTLGIVPANGIVTVTAWLHANSDLTGTITNTVFVTATGDPVGANNRAFVTSTVESRAELQIYKDDEVWQGNRWHDSDPVNPGSSLTYTLWIYNDGPSDAWDVTITDTVPTTVTGVTAGNDWADCILLTRTITCTAHHLPADDHWRRITIAATAPLTTGVITNTAWITASGSFVTPTTQISDTEITMVEPLANLAIDKVADPTPAESNGVLTYTITVYNAGPSAAANVVVVDTLQAGLTGDGLDGGDWTCDEQSNVVTCTLGISLTAGISSTVQITITAPPSGTIANLATVESDITDPDDDDNTVFIYTAIRPSADLVIAKSVVPTEVVAGMPLTYTIVVSNAGPTPAGSITTTLAITNPRQVIIHRSGRATPYPSALYIAGVEGDVHDITVTLNVVSHTYPADIVALLVGPGGQSVILMSNAGGGADIDDVTLVFHDSGATLPISSTILPGIVYRPTNYGLGSDLPGPAPAGPYGGSLGAFNGGSPNGTWQLYVYDSVDSDRGYIYDGWSLHITAGTTDTIVLTDTLPAGLTGVSVARPGGWTCTATDAAVDCETTYLAINAPAVFTITATSPITGGVITNTAVITATTGDPDASSNRVTITSTVIAVADLAIVKSVAPARTVGQSAPLTYTLTITNNGPGAVAGTIVVTDRLPAEITTVVPSGTGWACDLSALPLLTCTLDTGLPISGTSSLLLAATAPVTADLVITNTAGVNAAVSDPVTINNTSLVTVTVARQTNLEIVKTAESALVQPGDLLTFTIVITNQGPSDTSFVTMSDAISNAQLFAITSPSADWQCATSSNAFTCTLTNTLASGDSATFGVWALAPSVNGTMTNTAWITSAVVDLQPENNTSAVTVAVTLPPTATTGPNQTVYVDTSVTLSGTDSTDEDGDLPLAYGWQQTGGPSVALSDPTAALPTFTAPSTPAVLTFSLWVTDALGMPSDAPDSVVITVTDRAISGPAAFNDSPTMLGATTGLWATVVTGTNVVYTWDLGDGSVGSGQSVSHTYPAEGWYTAIVTATNSVNSLSATTLVSITKPPTTTLYLPLVSRNHAFAPDLVVDRIVATGNSIQVVISNQGDAEIENRFENEFWVDVYINPDRPPVTVNETWQHVGSRGIVWGVTQAALPLYPGESLTLTVTSAGGAYYYPGESNPLWPLPVGTTLYAQVDSAHENTTFGAINETHEIIHAPYENNILGPVISAASVSGAVLPPPGQDRGVPSSHLPPRP